MKRLLNLLLPVVVCFMVGFTASYFQSDAIESWYPYLNKPALTPPNAVFPIAWGIIYVCMGISIGLILNSKDKKKNFFSILFGIQLFLNFLWSLSFFYLQNPLLGLINIVLLDLAVLYYILKTYPAQKASALLFIPYALWLFFATYLNAYILVYN